MIDNAPTHPVKARITHGQQQRWKQEAAGFIELGESDAAIRAYLQEQGCPPRMRDELVRQARASVRGEHRGIGLRMFALGLAATLGGAACGFYAYSGIPVGDGARLYSGGLLKMALALLVLGVPPMMYGGWKLISGSAVAAPPAR